MTKNKKIKIAMVGFGYWSPKLLRNFLKFDSCEIVAVCDKDETKWPAIREAIPGVAIYVHYSEMIKELDIDAVVIGTTISSHFRIAHEALLGGKHVFLEKPMTVTVKEAEKLVKLADERNLIIMVDHTFVYSTAVQYLKKIISSGELGKIYSYNSSRLNLGLIQKDVNVLYDLAPHDFSILHYLIDEKPLRVSAVGVCPIKHEVQEKPLESIVYVTVEYKSGLLAHFHVSWLSPVKVRNTSIIGNEKMVVYDMLDPEGKVKIYDTKVIPKDLSHKYDSFFDYRVGNMGVASLEEKEDLELVASDFLKAVETGSKPLVDGKFGLQVVRFLEATNDSLLKDGKWINF